MNQRNYVLTKVKNKSGKAEDSDHATQILYVDLICFTAKPERREIFNFKESEAQSAFKVRFLLLV